MLLSEAAWFASDQRICRVAQGRCGTALPLDRVRSRYCAKHSRRPHLQEFTVPFEATDRPIGGLADAVFDNAAVDPHRVTLGRKIDGEWQDVTVAEFRDRVSGSATGSPS
jgi:hypothetical protein